MNLKYMIGILAMLILMVGTASAAVTEFYWTEKNANEAGLPAGTIRILVRYDDTASTLTFKSVPGPNGYVTNPRIGWVGYNKAINANSITAKNAVDGVLTTTWTQRGPTNMDGFGSFARVYHLDQQSLRPDEVIVNLPANTGPIDPNGKGNQFAIHFAWVDIRDSNGNIISGQGDTNLGDSTFISGPGTEIPEFPTIALPIAAILGLMFIFGRRKNE